LLVEKRFVVPLADHVRVPIVEAAKSLPMISRETLEPPGAFVRFADAVVVFGEQLLEPQPEAVLTCRTGVALGFVTWSTSKLAPLLLLLFSPDMTTDTVPVVVAGYDHAHS